MPTSYRVNAPNVSSENIDGEVIIVNLASGSYYSCVEVGAYLWSRIASGDPSEAIVDDLAGTYSIEHSEIATAVAHFVSELQREHLIVPAANDAIGAGTVIDAALPSEYCAPELNVYSDMQDMLLLDPVHDVADVGWPVKPE